MCCYRIHSGVVSDCVLLYSFYYKEPRREARNMLQTIERRTGNLISHILCRNSLLKHVIEGRIGGRIEVMERQGRRRESYWMTLRKREDIGN
jgi:hypothetical protein